ncbi:hypothetical protein M3936_11895 [Sutcliffiella horikoshii]|uniref:hypothetical protein n=1 Tax=Sutcliffiella horikoshii TaxID=79883 RepID=UPI00204156F0|nr:hypothetical protein [Sutcliffiella horikoshii]MCM3618281.1 hypothetical protein [Sutcliffiella horikoshii]
MSEFHLGDALFQLVVLGGLVVMVFLIVKGIRSFGKRKAQLDRLESKMDSLLEEKDQR